MNISLELCAEFQRISIPCGSDQQEQLKEDIVRNGCHDPIVIWNNVIIDGHKRYEICKAEEIEFSVRSMSFSNKEEAICWVCRQRITQVSDTSIARRYLVGMLYENERKLYRSGKYHTDSHPEGKNTIMLTASEMKRSPSMIGLYGQFARAMNKIAERSPQMFESILSGEKKISMRKIIEGSAYVDEEAVLSADAKAYSLMERRRREKEKAAMEGEQPLTVGIKNMPAFDPDMELRGLTFTIPTWIMSIERVEQKTNMDLATGRAKDQLAKALRELENQIIHTLEVIQ